MLKKIILLLILVLFNRYILIAQNSIGLFSQKIEILLESNISSFKNPRFFIGEDGEISAEVAVLNIEERILSLQGQVSYKSNNYLIIADKAEFTLSNQQLIFENASFYDNKNTIYATVKKIIRLSNDEYKFEEGYLTQCLPDQVAWYFKVTDLIYKRENYIYGHNLLFRLYNVPILYLPIYGFPVTTKRKTGWLIPEIRYNKKNKGDGYGFKIETPYFFNLAKYHDLTLTPGVYTQRGFSFGLEYNYAFIKEMRGKLKYWQISEILQPRDRLEEYLMENSDDKFPTRYIAEYLHKQKLSKNWHAYIKGYTASDNEVENDYFDLDYYEIDNNLYDEDQNLPKFHLRFDSTYFNNSIYYNIFAENKHLFEYRSRYNTQDLNNTLNENLGLNIFYKEIFNSIPITFSFLADLNDFTRDYGWNGNYIHSSNVLSYESKFLLGALKLQLNYDLWFYQTYFKDNENYFESSNFEYNQFTKIIKYSIDLQRELQYSNNLRHKLYVSPYIQFTDRDDVDSRNSLDKPPNEYFNNNYTDYVTYGDKFSNHHKLPARKNIDFGFNFKIKAKRENLTVFDVFTANISSGWNFLRDKTILDDSNYFSGPIIEEKHQITEIDDKLQPIIFNFHYTPKKNISINSKFNLYLKNNNLFNKKFEIIFGDLQKNYSKLTYIENSSDYKDLDGYIYPIQESLYIYRDLKLSPNWLISVRGKWDFVRAKQNPSQYYRRITNLLTEAKLNIKYTHCCYSFEFGTEEEILTRKLNNGVDEEYLDRKFYIQFNLLNNNLRNSFNY